jgi:hypothetical protein
MKTVGFYVAAVSSVKEISSALGRYPGHQILHRNDMRNDMTMPLARAKKRG